MMRQCAISLALLLVLLLASSAQAQFKGFSGDSIVDDPEWRMRFLGSYGFLSGAEPQVSPDELLLLREVIDLMKVNLPAAAARLAVASGDDSSAALDFVLANLEFQNGDLEPAAIHYRRAIEKFPDFRRAHKNLGLLLVQEQKFDKGSKHLASALELGDRDGRNYGLMGYCYLNLEHYLAAEVAYRNAILQQPEVRDWKLGLARSLLAMEKHREASTLFQHLIEEDPEDATSWMLQANALLAMNEPQAAAVNLEAVRMMGKAQISSLALLGDIYMNAGMFELARGAYLEVIERDRGGAQFSTAIRAAELLHRTKAFDDTEKLVAAIEKQYRKLPVSDELRVLTLKAKLARSRGNHKTAAKLLESIVARDGTRGDAILELAAYHSERGDREKAAMLYERAARLDEFEYKARLAHAQFLVSRRDYVAARDVLRKALAIKREARVEQFLARVEAAVRL